MVDWVVCDVEGVVDLLWLLGLFIEDEIVVWVGVFEVSGWLDGLCVVKCVFVVFFVGCSWWVVVEDMGWLCDGVGVVVLVGLLVNFIEVVVDLLGELLGCYVCIYILFIIVVVVVWFGFGLWVIVDVLGWLVSDGWLVCGEFVVVVKGFVGGE